MGREGRHGGYFPRLAPLQKFRAHGRRHEGFQDIVVCKSWDPDSKVLAQVLRHGEILAWGFVPFSKMEVRSRHEPWLLRACKPPELSVIALNKTALPSISTCKGWACKRQ